MKKTILLTALAALIPAFASATPITAYSMFGGHSTQIGANSKINSGFVGSNGNVDLFGNVLVQSNVDAGQDAKLGKSTTVNGNVTAGSQVTLGGKAHIDGNVYANQATGMAVSLGADSSVKGTITHNDGTNVTQDAGSSFGGSLTGATPFSPVVLRDPSGFSTGVNKVIAGGGDHTPIPLTAGWYDKVDLGANNTLNFTAGSYYFNSLDVGGDNIFNFDLTGGAISLYFSGNVNIGDHLNVVLTGGDASGLYAETNGNWTQGGFGNWFGTIYGSGAGSDLNFGQSSRLTGSFIATDNLTIGGLSVVNLGPAPAQGNVPEPASVLLSAAGLLGLALSRRRRS